MAIVALNHLPPEDDGRIKRRDSSSSSSRLSTRRQMLNRGRKEPSVLVSLYKVQHGTLKNGCPASIIVTDFQFKSTERSRIETAAINYNFKAKLSPTLPSAKAKPSILPPPHDHDEPDEGDEPALLVVKRIAPFGYASIQSARKEPVLELAALDLATMPPGAGVPVELSVSAGYTTSNKYVIERNNISAEQSTIAGTVRSRYREKDTARWMLTEDETEERGVPNYLRTAVLVERRDKDAEFVARIEVSVTLGGMSKARRAFGSTSDDAVTFYPGGNRTSQEKGIESFNGKDLDMGPWEEAVSYSLDASLGDEEDSRQPILISMSTGPSSEGSR